MIGMIDVLVYDIFMQGELSTLYLATVLNAKSASQNKVFNCGSVTVIFWQFSLQNLPELFWYRFRIVEDNQLFLAVSKWRGHEWSLDVFPKMSETLLELSWLLKELQRLFRKGRINSRWYVFWETQCLGMVAIKFLAKSFYSGMLKSCVEWDFEVLLKPVCCLYLIKLWIFLWLNREDCRFYRRWKCDCHLTS